MFPTFSTSIRGFRAHPVIMPEKVMELPYVRDDAIKPGIFGFAILPDGSLSGLSGFERTCAVVRAHYDELVENNLIVLPDGSKVVILPAGSGPQHAQVVQRSDEADMVFLEILFLYGDAKVTWRAPLFTHPLVNPPVPTHMLA